MAIGNPFTEVSVTGFNPSPPSNDGTQSTANLVDWDKQRDDLANPLKTALESTQSNITAALDKRVLNGVLVKTLDYTITVSDRGKVINFNSATSRTATLPAAADAKLGFEIIVKNSGTAALTLDGNASETIDGLTSLSLVQGTVLWLVCDGTGWVISAPFAASALPLGYISGLSLANDGTDAAHDVVIATGEARDGANATNMVLGAALTKQIDAAWAVGTDAGGLDGTESTPGTPDASTIYYVWLIKRSDTGVVDALFSESGTAPTMPTNYDSKRLLGFVVTDGSANIIAGQFMQVKLGKKIFVSAAQTISSAGGLTLAHGFGQKPDRAWAKIRCTTTDNGWAVGDENFIDFATTIDSAGTGGTRGFALGAPDSDNVTVRFINSANTIGIFNKSTGAPVTITNGSWGLIVYAEVDT